MRGKKFANLPHPGISRRTEEESRLGDNDKWVVGYGWNLEFEDDEGNEMIYLEIEMDDDDGGGVVLGSLSEGR